MFVVVDSSWSRLVLAAVVCAAGASCTPSFVPSSLVTESRVIGVVAEPPEATPGQTVTHTPIVVDTTGTLDAEDYGVSWWRCPDTDSDGLGDFWECTVPAQRRDLGGGVPYTDTIPADLFGTAPAPGEPVDPSTSPPEKILGAVLGYWRVVGMTMNTADHRVDSFKRVPVFPPFPLAQLDERLAAIDVHVDADGVLAPNTNPTISAVTVHEGSVTGATVAEVKRGGTYFFVPRIDDAQLEEYFSLKIDLAGLDVSDPESVAALEPAELTSRFERLQRCEIPVYNWFVTAGRLRREITLDEGVIERVYDKRGVSCPAVEGEVRTPDTQFTVPTGDEDDDPLPQDGIIHAWVVMRDGRGGTAFRSFDLVIAD